MKKEESNLDHMKGTNPFSVPEGYFEGLTDRIMAGLPDKSGKETPVISLMDRIRPWLYLAAVFAGLGLFFKAIVGDSLPTGDMPVDSLLVRTIVPEETLEALDEEDQEYLEYLEAQYADYLLKEEPPYSE